MTASTNFEVIIVGGSFAGLSAAMSLGRSLRRVLVIDSGEPCNRQTPHSHNFITQDGQTPTHILTAAKEQVARYDTVRFYDGLAVSGTKTATGFAITTQSGDTFAAKKLLFATGLRDVMPDLPGFAACWGISILHCPYCHGYEVRNHKTGILANGDAAFDLVKLIAHWTKDLTLFTNGPATLTEEQATKTANRNIAIVETEVEGVAHENGKLQNLLLKNGSGVSLQALYARPKSVQHCDIPTALGCELTEQGLIKVDMLQKTTVPGVYACGDNSQFARSVAVAVASGSFSGAAINRELIDEEF